MIIKYQIIYKHLIDKVIRISTNNILCKELLRELKERKYDIDTCNFPLVIPELNIIILSIN